jgi:hypothetical protein
VGKSMLMGTPTPTFSYFESYYSLFPLPYDGLYTIQQMFITGKIVAMAPNTFQSRANRQ